MLHGPMEGRVGEGMNYESLIYWRQDGDDEYRTIVGWSQRDRNFRHRMVNGPLPLAWHTILL